MTPSFYPAINAVLAHLLPAMQEILQGELLALYLYGSATAGDFDPAISDIDLLAVLKRDLGHKEFAALERMHREFAVSAPEWKDKIEVAYLAIDGLQTFKSQRSQIVVISPGEPLNVKDAGKDWLINWYVVRQNGVVVFGPEPATLIPTIGQDEFREAIKQQALAWRERIQHYEEGSSGGSCAYAVFTMCRAMYGYRKGEQASKREAAKWAAGEFPQWAGLLEAANGWRGAQWDRPQKRVGAALAQVVEFVNFAVDQVVHGKE